VIFTSLSYLLFFPVVVLLYFSLPLRFRVPLLLIASCIFYMAFIPIYILILFYLIVVDYFAGLWIEKSTGKSRRNFLLLSCAANIGALAVFKYYDFINMNLAALFSLGGLHYPVPHFSIILPIGLSFHTFQSLSYTFEVYYGRQKAETSPWRYALYVMFFPQLVAGPIERPGHLLNQLSHTKPFDYHDAVSGMRLIVWGFIQKLLIADKLAVYVDEAYAHPALLSGSALFVATVLFAFQIFCDFSAYSDIAIGSARVLRINLMKNFDAPYFSASVAEFWRRWHISLSTWFRDYVYIPLGGNRVSPAKRYRNLLIVFLLSGLWHGANWTFVVWGFIHGAVIILEDFCGRLFGRARAVFRPLRVAMTFLIVTLAWVFFRAATIQDALMIVGRIVSSGFSISHETLAQLYLPRAEALAYLVLIAGLLGVEAFQRRASVQQALDRLSPAVRWPIYYAAVLLLLIFGNIHSKQFIYFQF
jgi:D-alanyl-lipoteichoic acid acyltransferase DltB (MBOAT superfamily)